MLLGSSIRFPVKDPPAGGTRAKDLFVRAARNLRDREEGLVAKARTAAVDLALAASVPMHRIYSRYLLDSTVKRIKARE